MNFNMQTIDLYDFLLCITIRCAQSARCKMLFLRWDLNFEYICCDRIEDERKTKSKHQQLEWVSRCNNTLKTHTHTHTMISIIAFIVYKYQERIKWIIELWSKHRNLSPAHILSITNKIVHCGLGFNANEARKSQADSHAGVYFNIYIHIVQWMVTLLRCLRHLPLCYLVIGYMRSESFQNSSFSFQFGTGYERSFVRSNVNVHHDECNKLNS